MSKDRLNPKIREFIYGNKDLYSVMLYPLSIGDQKKALDIILAVVREVAKPEWTQASEVEIIETFVGILEKNIVKILSMVASAPEETAQNILDNCTNDQFVELITAVWDVNFEDAVKNGRSLFDRIRQIYPSRRPLPIFSDSSHSIDSKTSIPEASPQEDSPVTN